MNKIKLSKLTTPEKAFKLIHYASLIGRINYIYHRYNFFLPFDTSKIGVLKTIKLIKTNKDQWCNPRGMYKTNNE